MKLRTPRGGPARHARHPVELTARAHLATLRGLPPVLERVGARKTKCEQFGLLPGQYVNLQSFGVAGRLARNAPSVEIGRMLKAFEDVGDEHNTLVVYIAGDNGTSGEGGQNGMFNEYT